MLELSPGIVSDPEILGGRPIIKGHRIAVSQVLAQLAGGMTQSEVQSDYLLTDAEMQAVMNYAMQIAQEKERELTHAQHNYTVVR